MNMKKMMLVIIFVALMFGTSFALDCPKCKVEMTEKEDNYICPKCGSTIPITRTNIYHDEKSMRNEKTNKLNDDIAKSLREQPKEIREEIFKGKINIGWTKEQVILSLIVREKLNADRAVFFTFYGKPISINRTITKYGISEQWVFGYRSHQYLYFENDILTAIQD
jgi:uncharacterized Zn finger protein (UPF0148 family)